MNILWVHSGGIGDMILSFPAMAHVAAQGELSALGHATRLQLSKACGLAREVHDLDSVDFHTLFATATERLRTFLAPFDKAIVWMEDRGEIALALSKAGIPEVSCFKGIPLEDWERHASDYYLDCLKAPAVAPFPLRVPPSTAPKYDVILHPGSGGRKKNYPLPQFLEAACRLESQGRSIAWSLGPAEEGFTLPQRACTLPHCSLVDLAAILARADLYIGNDSGISHLAAAMGCPTIVLFGPTDPQVWCPLGPSVKVLTGSPWPAVEEVLAAMQLPFEKGAT